MTQPVSWTTENLALLEEALAQGVAKVKFSDREVTYQTRDEMVKTRNMMRKALGIVTSGPTRKLAGFSKGF